MFRNKMLLGIVLVVSLGLLASSGWAMGKSPKNQKSGEVEKHQVNTQTGTKADIKEDSGVAEAKGTQTVAEVKKIQETSITKENQKEIVPQGIPNQSLNKSNSYHNSFYGFKIDYVGELEERSVSEVIVKLPQFEESQTSQSYVSISTDQRPFVDLPGTYGGRFYFNNDSISALLSNRYAIEHDTDTVNGLVFTKEYWLVYGGMGNWETIINCYTEHQGRYYVISLVHLFLSGRPGEVMNGKKISKQELIANGLKAAHDNNNKYVNAFNAMLSSFSISK